MKKIVLKAIPGIFLVLVLAALPTFSQGRRPAGPPNPLVRLERALQAADAPTLTPDEQSRITSLISSTTTSQPPSSAVQALEATILAGNTDQIAAKTITDTMAANFLTRANFASSVAQILTSGGQLTPLVTKFGSTRVVQLLNSLVGGGFGGRHRLDMAGPEAR
jgi:hypothetical protein